jgi:tetratricopeptide (TPR) repeat protein
MKNDQEAQLWITRGKSLFKEKRYTDAIRCIDHVLQLDPGNASIWNNRGLCFSKLGRHIEAISCYDKALEIKPKFLSAWCNRGISFTALYRYEEALQCFDKALEINPQSPIAMNYKSYLKKEKDQSQNKLKNLGQERVKQPIASENDSQKAYNWLEKGKLLFDTADYREAINCLSEVIKIEPRNVFAWYQLAQCEEHVGDNSHAVYCYQQVLQFNDQEGLTGHAGQRITELEIIIEEQKNISRVDSKQ